ncbi:MAG TPA: response regulator [Bryobacteraceae bacterium]|jgi:two-component system OmpR family response regulator|nr:response regulator [Bryobacteraceae bacterium]
MLEILVVDEDRRYTRVAVECLTRDYNALVNVVEDGDDAMCALASEDYRPHLVLLELRNRSIPGLHVLRRIRRRRPKLPVVVWSASRNTEEILQTYAEGANMYAEKPPDLAHFRTTIHNIAQLWIAPFSSVKAAGAR